MLKLYVAYINSYVGDTLFESNEWMLVAAASSYDEAVSKINKSIEDENNYQRNEGRFDESAEPIQYRSNSPVVETHRADAVMWERLA